MEIVKKKIVVGISVSYINNYQILPSKLEVEVSEKEDKNYIYQLVILHEADAKSLETCDCAIVDSVKLANELKGIHGVPARAYPHYSKIDQATAFSNAANKLNLKRFIKIPTGRLSDLNFAFEAQNARALIFKNSYGARGLGQIYAALGKYSVVNRCTKIKAALATSTLAKLLESDEFILTASSEFSANESLEFANEIDMVQAVVENVQDEYRILTNHAGEIVWTQQRHRRQGPGIKKAYGGDGTEESKAELPPHVLKELKLLIAYLGIYMNSLDVFTTTDGKWGIFECCNQWGVAGVDITVAYQLQLDSVMDLVKQIHSST